MRRMISWWKRPPPLSLLLFRLPHLYLLSMNVFNDFSALSWNVRGFASKRSRRHMRKLLHRYKPDLVFIFETHTVFAGTKKFWDKEAYSAVAIEEAHGHSGSIWAICNIASPYSMHALDNMHQCISITVSKGHHNWTCSGVYASPIYSLCQ